MPIILGFVLGLGSAVFFAFYMVPQKFTRVDTATYLWAMAFGVLITALLAYALAGFPVHHRWWPRLAGVGCGVVWGLGTLCFSAGIGRLGLAQATPIKNTTGIFGTLVGLLILQEWRHTNPWLCSLGSLLIVVAAVIIGRTGSEETPRPVDPLGVMFALLAALCYASYLYPMGKAVAAIGYWEFTPWMAVGILITSTVGVLVRPGSLRILRTYPPRAYGLSLLGGVSWAIALYCLAGSMLKVGLAIAWSLAQLNTLPAVFLGILVFHEIHWTTHRRAIILGLLAATVGTVLLGAAK